MNFCKMNGAGNDFIIIDNRPFGKSESELSKLAAHLCERRMSIGADGLIAIEASQHGGDFRMRFFNSDGSKSEMCGNGARCICRYGYENGLAGEVQHIETDAGAVVGERISKREYRVLMNRPSLIEFDREATIWDTHLGCNRVYKCDYVELGSPGLPHAVLEYKGLRDIMTFAKTEMKTEAGLYSTGERRSGNMIFRPENDERVSHLREIGRAIRNCECFPKGTNVNFYEFTEDGSVFEATFERGVEDFTYACGSGSTSAAIVLALRGKLAGSECAGGECGTGMYKQEMNAVHTARLLMRGGELGVRVELAPEDTDRCAASVERVYLSGPTNMVAVGRITDDELLYNVWQLCNT
ncbi:MAG: diaminopimelate epimerase [Firmicutes bacterium]|nr:diaminopimelate epimerase [Bacillota bacterium]